MELQIISYTLDDLYLAVIENNIESIQEILNKNRELLQEIKPEYGCPIISIACYKKEINQRTIRELLELGANCSDPNGDEGWRPIHYAACEKNLDALKTLVEFSKKCINDRDQYGNNALHFLFKSKNKPCSDLYDCADFLIEHGINVHQKNAKNLSPLDLFFKNKDTESQMVIQDILSKYGKGLVADEPDDKLLEYINKEDDNNVLQELKKIPPEQLCGEYRTQSLTLLELCCDHMLEQSVKYLLEKGVSPMDFKNKVAPIISMAQRGLFVIFKILLDSYKLEDLPSDLLLTILINIDEGQFHLKCYRALIDRIKDCELIRVKMVNYADKMLNTPLMYALCFANSNIVLELLGLGAYLGSRNILENTPIKIIEPQDLKTHLNNSVILCEEFNRYDEEFKVTFKFDSLVQSISDTSDTEVVFAMTKSRGVKHLVAHPVVVSFITLKWRQYQMIFYANFAAFILFFLSYAIFIFLDYNYNNTQNQKDLRDAAKGILFLLTISLTIRELFQIFVEYLEYLKHLDNYLEWILIIVAYLTIFSNENKRELWAVSVLLLSLAFVLQLGQHPAFSTSIVMLRTVAFNFFKSFLAYCVLIFSFAVSFYILFTKNIKDVNEQNYVESFDTFQVGMFKTLVMLTGEFDTGNLTGLFSDGFFITRVVFVFFILIVHLILLNLLNGLAVSDTQVIRNDAELFGHIARVKYIRLVENVLAAEGWLSKLSLRCSWLSMMFRPVKDIETGSLTQAQFELDYYPNKNKFCEWSPYYKLMKNVRLNDHTLNELRDIIQNKVKNDTAC
ncbi:transient receptor potential cation channel protein painless-like [Anthonomus grandis grandis]|uniref:transient receptor potential cation channel protein painless-like n=1 Tax=Anthonomus grandis grandis TaxID=2921223 RepID=UPI0021663B5F|nr:transient receptor potential cation channel protein painless-like [Anthonomus grandis grandis]